MRLECFIRLHTVNMDFTLWAPVIDKHAYTCIISQLIDDASVCPVWPVCVLLFTVKKQLHKWFFFLSPSLTLSHVNTERFLFVSVCGGQVSAGWSGVTVKNRCGHVCCFRISCRSLSIYCMPFQFQPVSAVAGQKIKPFDLQDPVIVCLQERYVEVPSKIW